MSTPLSLHPTVPASGQILARNEPDVPPAPGTLFPKPPGLKFEADVGVRNKAGAFIGQVRLLSDSSGRLFVEGNNGAAGRYEVTGKTREQIARGVANGDYGRLRMFPPPATAGAAKNPAANDPANAIDAGQPFVGTVIKGQSLSNGRFQIPASVPGLGGKTIPAPPKGGDSASGLVVWFPKAKTGFVTSTAATVPVPAISKGTMLKWVATVSDKSVQYGLGNSIPVNKSGNSIFFWNVRADATDLARGAALSLRSENRGKEFTIGTLNAGLLHKPTCKEGEKPSHLADVVAGAGFQAKVVAKDGQIMVRHGKQLLPIAVWEASVAAAMSTVTELTSKVCDNKTILERAGDALKNAAGFVSNALNSEEAKEFGGAVLSIVTGVGGFLLDRLLPRQAY